MFSGLTANDAKTNTLTVDITGKTKAKFCIYIGGNYVATSNYVKALSEDGTEVFYTETKGVSESETIDISQYNELTLTVSCRDTSVRNTMLSYLIV